MQWITKLFARWATARARARENYLRALALANPGFQWLLVRAGTSETARSPMLATNEVADWFREFYPVNRIVHIDHSNHIVFYE